MAAQQRNNFYVVTGCSGGGKSSVIEALKTQGFPCVDEPGREIAKEQSRRGGDGTPWQDQRKFRDLLLVRYKQLFEQTGEGTLPVFFDRGLPEVLAASRLLGISVPDEARILAVNYRYARQVFGMPPWAELFKNDAERRHSFADALTEYPLTLEAYRECGYEWIEVPKGSVTERVKFILQHIGR